MATVTITEILGGDNIAASRIVINNNFTLLQNAINTLETRLNTSYVPGGSLNVGDAQILKYNRPVTQNIFLVQASAQIDGNLSLGTPTNNATLGITGFLTVSEDLTVADDVTFSNTGSNNFFTNNLSTVTNDSEADLQLYGIVSGKNPVFASQTATILPITPNTRVLYLDVSAYTGIAPNNVDAWTLPSVASVTNGQKVIIRFNNAFSAAGTSTALFELNNLTNFDPAFNNATLLAAGSTASGNIVLNTTVAPDATSADQRFKGIWIELVAASTGWRVIGSHPDVTFF
jgi:hypothetical protein